MPVTDGTYKALLQTMDLLRERLKKELAAQGHVLTGNLSKSLNYTITRTPFGYKATMYALDYGLAVEIGVKPDRIPFTPGRRGKAKGGKSKYIEGLVRFWKKRGLGDRESVRAAFATARIHKREGMPSRGSYQYSRTGERTGFVRRVLADNLESIGEIIANTVGAELQLELTRDLKIDPLVLRV